MPLDIKFEEHGIILSLITNDSYNEELTGLVKQLSRHYRNICYITTNTIYKVLVNDLLKNGIDANKFFFIDGITKTSAQEPEKVENCIFVDAPNSLTDISLNITRFLSLNRFDCFIFDSLSTLLIYDKSPTVTKFVHFLIENFRHYNCSAVFTALESDKDSELIKYIGLFVDKIHTTNKEFKEKISPEKIEKIKKLEKELEALGQGYKAGFISYESYKMGKERIDKEVEKLGKK